MPLQYALGLATSQPQGWPYPALFHAQTQKRKLLFQVNSIFMQLLSAFTLLHGMLGVLPGIAIVLDSVIIFFLG